MHVGVKAPLRSAAHPCTRKVSLGNRLFACRFDMIKHVQMPISPSLTNSDASSVSSASCNV